MKPNSQNRRGLVEVNVEQKKRFVNSLAIVPGLALSISLIAITWFCYDLNSQANRLEVQLDSLLPLFFVVSAFVAVSAISIVANARTVAHRVEGPAYRLQKSLEQVAEGDVSFRVKLREHDHLVPVCDALNRVLDVLNQTPPEGFRTRAMAAAEAETEVSSTNVDVDAVPAPVAADETTPAT